VVQPCSQGRACDVATVVYAMHSSEQRVVSGRSVFYEASSAHVTKRMTLDYAGRLRDIVYKVRCGTRTGRAADRGGWRVLAYSSVFFTRMVTLVLIVSISILLVSNLITWLPSESVCESNRDPRPKEPSTFDDQLRSSGST
jgi:hypothetical protein